MTNMYISIFLILLAIWLQLVARSYADCEQFVQAYHASRQSAWVVGIASAFFIIIGVLSAKEALL